MLNFIDTNKCWRSLKSVWQYSERTWMTFSEMLESFSFFLSLFLFYSVFFLSDVFSLVLCCPTYCPLCLPVTLSVYFIIFLSILYYFNYSSFLYFAVFYSSHFCFFSFEPHSIHFRLDQVYFSFCCSCLAIKIQHWAITIKTLTVVLTDSHARKKTNR